MTRCFTCMCLGPHHGKATGCSGTGVPSSGGLCDWCIANCYRVPADAHRFEAAAGPGFEACRFCGRGVTEHPARKCGTLSCDADASTRIYWPGQIIDLCAGCALRALNIAEAMELQLAAEPLP